jgi:hypothetical protein
MLITNLLPLLARYSLGFDLVAGPDHTVTLTVIPAGRKAPRTSSRPARPARSRSPPAPRKSMPNSPRAKTVRSASSSPPARRSPTSSPSSARLPKPPAPPRQKPRRPRRRRRRRPRPPVPQKLRTPPLRQPTPRRTNRPASGTDHHQFAQHLNSRGPSCRSIISPALIDMTASIFRSAASR